MRSTRRDFLKGAGAVAATYTLAPVVARTGTAWAETGEDRSLRRRLVLIELSGGNDGLNMVIPTDGDRRLDYEAVRGVTEIARAAPLKLDRTTADRDQYLGLHPNLKAVHALYGAGRVAVVQGVGMPNDNFSHFLSTDIWQSGQLEPGPRTGWVGRYLDRVGVSGDELRAIAVGTGVPRLLVGDAERGIQLTSLPMVFADWRDVSSPKVRAAYAGYANHSADEPMRRQYGHYCAGAVDLTERTKTLSIATNVPTTAYFVKNLLAAREMLVADLGVEVVTVRLPGFDTHTNQTALHNALMTTLNLGIEAFFSGTYNGSALTKPVKDPVTGITTNVPIGPLPDAVAARTVVMTWSEFGRRFGDNGDGTDHGAAQPVLMVGPPDSPLAPSPLVPGIHREHPATRAVGGAAGSVKNLGMTTDLRALYQTLLTKWLAQPANLPAADPVMSFPLTSGSGYDENGAITGLFR